MKISRQQKQQYLFFAVSVGERGYFSGENIFLRGMFSIGYIFLLGAMLLLSMFFLSIILFIVDFVLRFDELYVAVYCCMWRYHVVYELKSSNLILIE